MNYKEQVIKLNEINLDQDNPRFPPVNSQREAIEAMLKDQGDKITNLAVDIYHNGLNPSSKLILFKEKSRHIDGDGNRRLTALKILETPALADSVPAVRKRIDALLKKSGTVPSKVGCVVFDSREAARHWISINHGGEQEGRGQINWNAEQKDRFERKPSVGLEALDQLTNRGLITRGDRDRINKSTLDRLLSFKNVKSKLAISKKGEHFVFGNVEYLKRAVLGLRDTSVDEVYTAQKGDKFIETAVTTRTSEPEQGNTGVIDTAENDDGGVGSQGSRSKRVRKPGLPVFGGKLSLKTGHINNLYRDIESLYNFYLSDKRNLSADFIVIFRMSLRLLAETAAEDGGTELQVYIRKNFDQAKKSLSQDAKTSLSSQSVSKETIVQLFHTGAHDYTNSKNEEQALAMSVILGAILIISHGKNS